MLNISTRPSEFRLPWISPLAGATWPIIRKVFRGNKVDPKYRVKVRITYVFLTVGSAFRWFDRLWFRRKVESYVFREPPLFILGHWRSGTTYLHSLMTRDPLAAFTTTYQCVFPENMKSKWLFKTFMQVFMPRERPGDRLEISASWPQEDEYGLSNLTPHSFYHFFYFPSSYRSLYRKYVRFETLSDMELHNWQKTYRQLLIKALINTGGSRIILKNPVNTGRIPVLAELFPEAKFIHIIRNPVVVYLSTRKFFTQLFPTLQLEPFSEEEISDMILDLYRNLMQDYLEDKKQVAPGRLIEIKFEELLERPMQNLENIYSSFDLPHFQALKPDFEEYLESIEGHRIDSYTMSRKELDRVMDYVGFAMKHWNYPLPENLTIV